MNAVERNLDAASNELRELADGELAVVEGGLNTGWVNGIVRALMPILYGGMAPYRPRLEQ